MLKKILLAKQTDIYLQNQNAESSLLSSTGKDRGATREFLRGGDTNFGLKYIVTFLCAVGKSSLQVVTLFRHL